MSQPALTSPAYVVHDAGKDFKLEQIALSEMQDDERLGGTEFAAQSPERSSQYHIVSRKQLQKQLLQPLWQLEREIWQDKALAERAMHLQSRKSRDKKGQNSLNHASGEGLPEVSAQI